MFTDPIIISLQKKYPPPSFTDRSAFLFEDLIEAIISQQLSIKAADTIFNRFKALFTSHPFPSPHEILATPEDTVRTAGISFQKISYLKAIATAFMENTIHIEKLAEMTDEDIITHLTQIRGVGRWTAEMILMFTLNRPDVFSLGDLGLRNAIHNLYSITDKNDMLSLATSWSPYRSTASWYLWRSLENATT